MKDPKIDWPSDSETQEILDTTGKTKSEIRELIEASILQAQKMAKRGVDAIAPILDDKRSTWESSWNNNTTLIKWFGKVTQANHVKDVHRRLDDVCNRFASKAQTIKVKADLPHDYHAQNLGGPLSPNTFKVAPEWINMGLNDRAAVMIHESEHVWFKDQKIDGETVYGSVLAKKLARENPSKARRSPENYEQYCRELQEFQDRYEAKLASGSQPISRAGR